MNCPKCGYDLSLAEQIKLARIFIKPAGKCPRCGKDWFHIKDLLSESYYCPYCSYEVRV